MSLTDAFVEQARSMPAMPEVATRVLDAMKRDDLSLNELASLIGRDQALSTKILRVANSARFSSAREVLTLNDAAAALGLRHLRDLTVMACLVGAFPVIRDFDRLGFWRSTLALASYAQVLAGPAGVEPDTAYLGGLMLRTGQMLMTLVQPQEAAEVSRCCNVIDGRMQIESEILGCSHPEVTAELARHWHFPDPLIRAFGAAIDPLEVQPFSRLGAVLRLASVICDCHELEVPVVAGLLSTHAELIGELGLDSAWLGQALPDFRLASAGAEALVH
jgi:HD-like signal output (HDOD) protein